MFGHVPGDFRLQFAQGFMHGCKPCSEACAPLESNLSDQRSRTCRPRGPRAELWHSCPRLRLACQPRGQSASGKRDGQIFLAAPGPSMRSLWALELKRVPAGFNAGAKVRRMSGCFRQLGLLCSFSPQSETEFRNLGILKEVVLRF